MSLPEVVYAQIWDLAGFPPSDFQPSSDIIMAALVTLLDRHAALVAAVEHLRQQHQDLALAFFVLQARERVEHEPVSGTIRFVPGQAVRGRITFTASS